ncbi:MAG: cupin domain-containing protein, partial [Pseudomonadota bacterium]
AASAALLMGGCGSGGESAGTDETEATDIALEPAPPREAVIRDANEGDLIPFPLHPARSLAGPDTHEAAMSFFEIEVPAGTAGAPPHTHAYEDEFFYVREGRITFMAGDQRRTIGAGGFVLLPRGGQHAFWNDTEDDAILLLGTSEGEFGDFFDAVAMAVREENAARPDEIGAIVGRLGAARGIAIDMSAVPA